MTIAWKRVGLRSIGFVGLVILGMLIGKESLTASSRIRDILAFAIAMALVGVALRRPKAALLFLLGYLPMMGFIRRLLIPWTGWTAYDPLVLLAPTIVGILYLGLMFTRFRQDQGWTFPDDRITTLVQWLILVQIMEIFNPLQGSMLAGLAGSVFSLIPLLWMVLSREYIDEQTLQNIMKFVLIFGVIAALYGLRQTFYGLLPFEQEWVALAGYMALNVGNHIRAFSTFSNAAEYALFLSMAIVVAYGFVLKGSLGLRVAMIPVMGLLGYALFLESSRSPIVLTLFGMLMMTVVSQKQRGRQIGAILGFAVIIGIAYHFMGRITSGSGALVTHQLDGLLHPFDSQDSTLNAHFSMMISGFVQGFKMPIGHGLGSTTMGGSLFGGSSASTEVDFSNMFVSSGLVGGGLYLAIIVTVFRKTWMIARNGSWTAIVVLGLISVALLNWLNGGDYSTAAIVWVMLGWVATQSTTRKDDISGNFIDADCGSGEGKC